MSEKRQDEFSDLIERVRAGSPEAAAELVRSYRRYILHVVRKMLNDQLRAKFDSRDFEQDVWASFFADLPQTPFSRPENLIAFLTSLARNKVADEVRVRLEGRKHNLNRETSLEALAEDKDDLVLRQPTASELAMAREEWERLLNCQPPAYRRMLILVRAGRTIAETARDLDVSERTVRRVIEKKAPWLIS